MDRRFKDSFLVISQIRSFLGVFCVNCIDLLIYLFSLFLYQLFSLSLFIISAFLFEIRNNPSINSIVIATEMGFFSSSSKLWSNEVCVFREL